MSCHVVSGRVVSCRVMSCHAPVKSGRSTCYAGTGQIRAAPTPCSHNSLSLITYHSHSHHSFSHHSLSYHLSYALCLPPTASRFSFAYPRLPELHMWGYPVLFLLLLFCSLLLFALLPILIVDMTRLTISTTQVGTLGPGLSHIIQKPGCKRGPSAVMGSAATGRGEYPLPVVGLHPKRGQSLANLKAGLATRKRG